MFSWGGYHPLSPEDHDAGALNASAGGLAPIKGGQRSASLTPDSGRPGGCGQCGVASGTPSTHPADVPSAGMEVLLIPSRQGGEGLDVKVDR